MLPKFLALYDTSSHAHISYLPNTHYFRVSFTWRQIALRPQPQNSVFEKGKCNNKQTILVFQDNFSVPYVIYSPLFVNIFFCLNTCEKLCEVYQKNDMCGVLSSYPYLLYKINIHGCLSIVCSYYVLHLKWLPFLSIEST